MRTQIGVSASDLAVVEIFAELPRSALKRIAANAVMRRLPAKTQVFRQGDTPARAHVVVGGAVRIVQTGTDGEQTVMRFIVPGEIFGAMALFTDGRYPADAITLVETLEISWSEAELLAFMNLYPTISISALRVAGRRLQEAQNRVREISTQSAERRIAHALLRLSRQTGRPTPDGTLIWIPLRRQDLADLAGTTLYTASRVLTSWEKAGFVRKINRHLVVREPEQLARVAATDKP